MVVAAMLIGAISMIAGPAKAQRYMEKLDRGLIAVKSGSGYFLSWRLFGTDPQDTSFGFNVYKGTTKLNATVITNSTNYQDNSTGTGTYTVKAVTNGVEGETSENALVIDAGYLNIPITPPPGGTDLGGAYTYSANDASVGDLDGDGQYEIVLKWDPSDSRDNEMTGYTGNVILDAYKLDGTKLWRIDLGPNIRAGAHYTQFLVYDFDGDGMAEVAMKTAPGTKDGTGNFLQTGDAAGADNTANYVSTAALTAGKIISGPEWYTVFAGKTGAELATINYQPGRGAEGIWGAQQGVAVAEDMGWGNDDVYNFVDRHLASVAYLDGERPSLIPCRGYYWRTALWALDWRNGQLTQRWLFDTLNGGTGKDGKPLHSSSGYESQGSHSLRQGDIDGDGFDEIVYGSMAVDHDGQGLWSTGLRHGDDLHLSDLDPTTPGLEIWMVHEQVTENGGISTDFRSAADGKIWWEQTGTTDNGRGCTGPLIAGTTGWQVWSAENGGLFDSTEKTVGAVPSSDNFTMWWGADVIRFLENGTSITPYGNAAGTGLNATGCASNNGSKSDPALTADIFGDWREEVVYRTTASDALRIYTTTTPTTNRLYTLMHDPIYRMSVATENVAYNQPPEPGIYIGPGMTLPEAQPNIKYYGASPPTGGTPTGGTGGGAGGTTGSTSTPAGTGGASGGASGGNGGAAGGSTVVTTSGRGGTTAGSSGGAIGGSTGGIVTSGGAGGAGGIATSAPPASGGSLTPGSTSSPSASGGSSTRGSTSSPSASGGSSTPGSTSSPSASGGSSTPGATSSPSASGGSSTPSATNATGSSGCTCRLAGADRSATPWGVMLVFGVVLAGKVRRRFVGRRRPS
jgi:rhamnogalacturonan endolyase